MEYGYVPYINNEDQFNISELNSTELIFSGTYMENCVE